MAKGNTVKERKTSAKLGQSANGCCMRKVADAECFRYRLPPTMSRVFVTGMGVVSSLGLGRKAFWDAIVAGRSGFSTIDSFDTGALDRSIAGEVKGFRARDFMTSDEARRSGRSSAISLPVERLAR